MRCGQMRDRIVIQRFFPSTDPRFGEAGEMVPVASGWANVTPLDGTETVNAQAVASNVSHRITMRYLANVTAKHQVLYRNEVLDIVSAIDPDGRRRTLVIEAMLHPVELQAML